MRLMIGIVLAMVVCVLSLSLLTPAGGEITGEGSKLSAKVDAPS